MKKNSTTDYLGYLAVRTLGAIIRALPIGLVVFFGRCMGRLWYCVGFKQRAQVYVNIKRAFQGDLPAREIRRVSRMFFSNLVCNILETFLISKIDCKYLDKYIEVEGEQYISEGLKHKKGVILLAVHAGSWELANTAPALWGYPYSIFVRIQKNPRLDELLNASRVSKGCKLIKRGSSGMRDVIRVLNNNEVLGMVSDHGGKAGVLVDFFGSEASMSTLAVRLALRSGCQVLPIYCARVKGPYCKIIIRPPFELTKSGDADKDVKENLERLSKIFQGMIFNYPADYLWTYKIWKYSTQRSLLILSDGKAGHLRQSQALGQIVRDCLLERGIELNIQTVEVKVKDGLSRAALDISCRLSGRYTCQGCLWCLRSFLDKEARARLMNLTPDYVLSCGASLSAVNCLLAKENLAQSIVIMRPSMALSKFDIAVIPRHDNPAAKKNVVVTEGALNLIDADYLKSSARQLAPKVKITKDLVVGVLLGGDTKGFELKPEYLKLLLLQVKTFLDKYDGELLITTSRRTNAGVENLIRQEFYGYGRCKLMVIANDKNIPEAVGGILALSKIILVSAESISMVSEAASCGKHTIVFGEYDGLGRRHRAFLEHFARQGYVHLSNPADIGAALIRIVSSGAPAAILNDKETVKDAMRKRLR
jgi:lauroyl/myristoyl acyltransferase/mitochondrial fission protein ELM1